MESSKLPSLDPFDELDPPGNDQEEYEDRLGEGITKLSREKVNGMSQMVIEMLLTGLKTVMIRKCSVIYA